MGFSDWKRSERARLEAGSRVVATARGPVELAELGSGLPLLALHGRPGGYDQGLLMARRLGPDLGRWLAVSRPGYLRTPLDSGRSPDEQADAYAALLDALELPGAAAVALSGGGPSALAFARRHPARCLGLVLIAAVTRRKTRQERPAGQVLFDRVCESDRLAWALYSLLGPVLGREGLASALVLPASLRGAGRLNDIDQFARLGDAPPSGIVTPTLIVHGERDRIVPNTHAEAARAAIPGAILLSVAKAGHSALFTHAWSVVPRVREFLTALSR